MVRLLLFLISGVLLAQEPVLHTYREVSVSHIQDDTYLELLPSSSFSNDLRKAVLSLNPRMGVEISFFLPLEKAILDDTALPKKIYNLLHAHRSLEGLTFFSAFEERTATLFTEAWTINNPKERTRIPDTTFSGGIPTVTHGYSYVTTADYGKVIYDNRYAYLNGNYWMTAVNSTTLRIGGIFTVARPGNAHMHLLIVPVKGGLQIYGNTVIYNALLTRNSPFIPYEHIQGNLRGRIRSLFLWIRDEIISDS